MVNDMKGGGDNRKVAPCIEPYDIGRCWYRIFGSQANNTSTLTNQTHPHKQTNKTNKITVFSAQSIIFH